MHSLRINVLLSYSLSQYWTDYSSTSKDYRNSQMAIFLHLVPTASQLLRTLEPRDYWFRRTEHVTRKLYRLLFGCLLTNDRRVHDDGRLSWYLKSNGTLTLAGLITMNPPRNTLVFYIQISVILHVHVRVRSKLLLMSTY